MFRILPTIIGIVTAISFLCNAELHATCKRCKKIEQERARQQTEQYQKYEYDNERPNSPRLSNNILSSQSQNQKKEAGILAASERNNGTFSQMNNEFNNEFFEEKEALKHEGYSVPPIEQSDYLKKPYYEKKSDVSADHPYSALLTIFKTKLFLETLDGSFTLFLPSNEAFSKLPAQTLENLLHPENQEYLAAVVSNHVVAKKYLQKDFEASENQEIKAISGRNLSVYKHNGQLVVDGAHILRIEPGGYDGVMYVIDKVLFP